MNFADFDFWIQLGTALLVATALWAVVAWLAPDQSAATGKICFATTSLYLLWCESPHSLAVFLWVAGLAWLALVIAAGGTGRGRTALFSLCVAGQILPLLYFKYWGFLSHEVLGLGGAAAVMIPMGISFYTFQKVAMCIDSRRERKPLPAFLDYLNFASFFPQIVAGPIERRADLLPQMANLRPRVVLSGLGGALGWIVLGLFYKIVIADNLGAVHDLARISSANAWHVWLECFSFGLRIYFDFAGYSFIAVGLAMAFGVTLTHNFRSPYWSSDLREFWRRWHITLSRWLRDYVFFPLGGSRTRFWAVNVMIVFLVSGIWHGAGWNFLLWGALHGAGVAFSSWGKPWALPVWLKRSVTLLFVTVTWLFFFETNTARLREKALTLVTPEAYAGNPIRLLDSLFPTSGDAANLVFLWGLALLCLFAERRSLHADEPCEDLRRFPVTLIMVALIILLAPMREAAFLYFNF